MSMYASKDKYESGDVARIIWEQLGGNKFRMMTGAKTLLNLGDGVAMKLGRNSSNSNYLKITLNSMDTYDMTFAKLTRMGELKSVKEYNNVYNDMLTDTFTSHTGMYTSLFQKMSIYEMMRAIGHPIDFLGYPINNKRKKKIYLINN